MKERSEKKRRTAGYIKEEPGNQKQEVWNNVAEYRVLKKQNKAVHLETPVNTQKSVCVCCPPALHWGKEVWRRRAGPLGPPVGWPSVRLPGPCGASLAWEPCDGAFLNINQTAQSTLLPALHWNHKRLNKQGTQRRNNHLKSQCLSLKTGPLCQYENIHQTNKQLTYQLHLPNHLNMEATNSLCYDSD